MAGFFRDVILSYVLVVCYTFGSIGEGHVGHIKQTCSVQSIARFVKYLLILLAAGVWKCLRATALVLMEQGSP